MSWWKETPPEDQVEKQMGFDDFDLKLGDLMRGERATLGKSLLDVQRELHIRATYIAAIENGDLTAFEAPSFVAGYVRSYARYLKMSPDWAYEKFCAETNFSIGNGMSSTVSPAKKLNPVRATPPEGMLSRSRYMPAPEPFWRRVEPGALGSITVLVALILGIGYGAWSVLEEVQRVQVAPLDHAPEVMANLDPLMGTGPAAASTGPQAVDLASSVDASPLAEGVVRVYRPQALDVPVLVSRDGPIAAINPRVAESQSINFDTTSLAVNAAISEALVADMPLVQVVENQPPRVEIMAVRPSWVRVRSADGTVLFEKILDAGERYSVLQTEAPATLRAGNSGSVYFVVNGQTYGPASPGAQVVSNLTLSADALQDRFQVADLTSDPALVDAIALADAGGN
jgi:hypothetical protein